jgi:hypothetical protein
MRRRRFIAAAAASLAALAAPRLRAAATSRVFALARRRDRWWLVTPEGAPFFSLALNHIDPSPLRYAANGDLWARKYGNSMERWLREAVAPDLLDWGFNSVGWTQEVVTRGPTNHRHSRAFTFEEYQWLELPYFHQLPFADFHQWEAETRHPDFSAPEFAEWCDYVAREHCARMADDPKLIGYFYLDCPIWVHTHPHSRWKGPLFDPAKLENESGRRELLELAARYYRITHDAVRRYDRRHLIFGDRYEAGGRLAPEVFAAAQPYVDAFCFQHFTTPEKAGANLDDWHGRTGKPVLLADHAAVVRLDDGAQRHDGAGYAATLARLRASPGCVGYHLCGAYLRNETRKRGLRDAAEQPDTAALAGIRTANRETGAWMREA